MPTSVDCTLFCSLCFIVFQSIFEIFIWLWNHWSVFHEYKTNQNGKKTQTVILKLKSRKNLPVYQGENHTELNYFRWHAPRTAKTSLTYIYFYVSISPHHQFNICLDSGLAFLIQFFKCVKLLMWFKSQNYLKERKRPRSLPSAPVPSVPLPIVEKPVPLCLNLWKCLLVQRNNYKRACYYFSPPFLPKGGEILFCLLLFLLTI